MTDDRSWVLLQLDEKAARRSGMPTQIPIMKKDMELLADKGLTKEMARKFITSFQRQAPPTWRSENAALAARYDAYLGKATFNDRAEEAMKRGDVDAAIKDLSSVARLDKQDHGARMNLAVAYAQKGDATAALKELDAAAPTFTGDVDYHCTRGQILLSTGDTDGALDQFVLALDVQPDSRVALDALVKLGVLVAVYEDPRDAASLAYVRHDAVAEHLTSLWTTATAETLLEQLTYHESEARHDVVLAAASLILARAEATDAQRERAETARISALREQGNQAEALTAAKSLVSSRENSAPAYVELARCLERENDATGARGALDRALEIDAGDSLALTLRFWPTDRDNLAAVQGALPALAEFAAAHPASAGAKRSLARAKLVVGSTDAALALFSEATTLAPNDDDLRAELWAELSKIGRHTDVIAEAETLGDMPKRSWLLRWSEAEAYSGAGRKVEAQAAFAALAGDESLHASLRKRARRAATRVAG